jgi:TolA-binding protein
VTRNLILLLLLVAPLSAAPPTTCGLADDYSRALCAYQRRQFGLSERDFRSIMEKGEVRPETVKAMYFLARTLMKTGRFEEAADLLVRIYETDRPFYDGWNCDFLLGECRRALGKE